MEEKLQKMDETEHLPESEPEIGIAAGPAYLHGEFYTMLRELGKIREEKKPGRGISLYLSKVEARNPLCGQWLRYAGKMLELEDQLEGKDVFSFISDRLRERREGKIEGADGPETQKDLCREIKISPSAYSMRKVNGTPFSREEIRDIVEVMHLPPEYSECLFWIAGCPMDVNDPFYLQLMRAVYEVLDKEMKRELKARLPWLEALAEPDGRTGEEEAESSELDCLRAEDAGAKDLKADGPEKGSFEKAVPETGVTLTDRGEQVEAAEKEEVDFWDLLEEIRREKGLTFVSIMPDGMPECSWRRYKKNRTIPGIHDILRCCISLRASILQTSRLLSSAGYTFPDAEQSRSARELMQQILDFNRQPSGPAQAGTGGKG